MLTSLQAATPVLPVPCEPLLDRRQYAAIVDVIAGLWSARLIVVNADAKREVLIGMDRPSESNMRVDICT